MNVLYAGCCAKVTLASTSVYLCYYYQLLICIDFNAVCIWRTWSHWVCLSIVSNDVLQLHSNSNNHSQLSHLTYSSLYFCKTQRCRWFNRFDCSFIVKHHIHWSNDGRKSYNWWVSLLKYLIWKTLWHEIHPTIAHDDPLKSLWN